MTFFSVLLALIIEQVRALSPSNPVFALFQSHAESAAHGFDAGKKKHGVLAWLVVVLPWVLAVGLVYFLLYKVSFVLAFLWNVVVVYFTLGFRQFSHYFTDIHLALNNDDVPRARDILREWTGIDTVDMPVGEIVRHTLIHAVVASHRHVFGVFSGSSCRSARRARCYTGSPNICRAAGRCRRTIAPRRSRRSRSARSS